MIKAVIYTRVSTEEQVHGYSLESQKEKCLAKAESLGVHDSIIFEEAGVSGEVANRPALMDAISTLHSDPAFRYFICTDPDRLSRQLANLLVFTGQIERNGVQLIFTDFTRESTPEGELFYSMRGAIAQFEKEMIKRRTTTGKIKKAREHKWTHWADIYGYDYKDGEVTVNEREAEIVRLIYKLGAQMGVASVCRRLETMGIQSPRGSSVWSRTTVRRILDNESYYTGKTYIRKYDSSGTHLNKYRSEDEKVKRKLRPPEEWVEMEIPVIIDEETFKAARRRRENARRKSATNTTARFLLSGLLRCATCGRTWHGYSTTRRGERVTYYVCTYKSPGPPAGVEKCPTNFIPTERFDEVVWNTIAGWIVDDKKIDRFHEQRRERVQQKPHDSELEILRSRFEDLNREEDALIERLAKEQNARLRLKLGERLDKLAAELDQVQALINELTVADDETAVTEVDRGTISWIRSNFPEPDKMTWEQRFEVIHKLVKEIEVQKTEDGYHLDMIPS